MNHSNIGIVVIGRNEGDRLKRCLQSLIDLSQNIVYVDSGSTDDSLYFAESIGIHVLELDMRIPFSAARARNEGFNTLLTIYADIEFVQFIDGDCEIDESWLPFAVEFLKNNNSYAIIAGRRHELYPEKSIYNLMCDIEWNSPIGDAKSCGGDFFIRKSAFLDVSGFNPSIIAGEEPELCLRLRKKGWKIYRADHSMTKHDAAMMHFAQWWYKAIRSGHAYAQGLALHGMSDEKFCVKDSLRIWFWSMLLPLFILLTSFFINLTYLGLLVAYPLNFFKIAMMKFKQLKNRKHSYIYSFFVVIGKFPQWVGQIKFIVKTILHIKPTIIEYK